VQLYSPIVEQWQRVGLIPRRPWVRIPLPQPKLNLSGAARYSDKPLKSGYGSSRCRSWRVGYEPHAPSQSNICRKNAVRSFQPCALSVLSITSVVRHECRLRQAWQRRLAGRAVSPELRARCAPFFRSPVVQSDGVKDPEGGWVYVSCDSHHLQRDCSVILAVSR
jgi:hypothetical protein